MRIRYTCHHALQHTHKQNLHTNAVQYYTCISVYGTCILYTCLHLCVVYIDVLARLCMCRLDVCEHSAYLLFVLSCIFLNCSYKECCNCVLCAAVSCGPAPDVPANGQRNVPGTTFGFTVTYTCDPGYTLQGDSTRTCMANGQWSGVTTRCSRKQAC